MVLPDIWNWMNVLIKLFNFHYNFNDEDRSDQTQIIVYKGDVFVHKFTT